MNCPRCGRELKEGEKFCPGCGYRFAGDEMPRKENTPPSGYRPKPKGGRIVMAVLTLLLFVGVMFGAQSCVMSGYMTSLMLENGMAADIDRDAIMAQAESLISAVYDKSVEILLVSNLITLLIICLVFRLRRKSPRHEMGVFFVNPFRLVTFAVFGTALNVFFAVTIPLLPLPDEIMDAVNSQFADLYTNAPLFTQIFAVAVVTPVVEELIFRGIGMTKLKPVIGSVGAAAVTALVFGFAHGTVVAVLYAAVMGAVFALMYIRYNSVVPSVIAHAFFNLTSFWLQLVPDGAAIIGVYIIAAAMLVWCAYRIFVRYPTFSDVLSDRDSLIAPINQTEEEIFRRLGEIQRREHHDLDELSDEVEELEKKWSENRIKSKKK